MTTEERKTNSGRHEESREREEVKIVCCELQLNLARHEFNNSTTSEMFDFGNGNGISLLLYAVSLCSRIFFTNRIEIHKGSNVIKFNHTLTYTDNVATHTHRIPLGIPQAIQ